VVCSDKVRHRAVSQPACSSRMAATLRHTTRRHHSPAFLCHTQRIAPVAHTSAHQATSPTLTSRPSLLASRLCLTEAAAAALCRLLLFPSFYSHHGRAEHHQRLRHLPFPLLRPPLPAHRQQRITAHRTDATGRVERLFLTCMLLLPCVIRGIFARVRAACRWWPSPACWT
jgi:hypothetical protein